MFLQQARCAYVIIVMAILWLTEAIPIPVTALMPIFLFPLTKTLPASLISGSYFTVCFTSNYDFLLILLCMYTISISMSKCTQVSLTLHKFLIFLI